MLYLPDIEACPTGKALGVFSLSRMTAALCGPMIGGVLCQFFGWRSTFWFCAIGDSICFLISLLTVSETLRLPTDGQPPEVPATAPPCARTCADQRDDCARLGAAAETDVGTPAQAIGAAVARHTAAVVRILTMAVLIHSCR